MSGILILTAVELEARVLARRLELPPITVLPFPAFGRGLLRVAPVGLRAGLLVSRWPRLLAGFNYPLVVSGGVCGGLAPDLSAGDLVLPESVLGPERRAAQRDAHAAPAGHRAGRRRARRHPRDLARGGGDGRGQGGALREHAARWRWTWSPPSSWPHAAAAGCPTLVVRGVSDAAGESVPLELIELMTPEGKLRPVRALALTRHAPAAAAARPRPAPGHPARPHRGRAGARGARRLLTAVNVLVTGGTGFVGANLVRELLADGHTVRVLARPGGDRRALEGCAVDIVEGDLLDAGSLRAAVAGARHVYHVAADYRLWAPDLAGALPRQRGRHAAPAGRGGRGGRRAHRLHVHGGRGRHPQGRHPGRRDDAGVARRHGRRLQGVQVPGRAGGRRMGGARRAGGHRQSRRRRSARGTSSPRPPGR